MYQAARDQVLYETILPVEVLRPVNEVDAPQGLVYVPGHEHVFVGRDTELTALETVLDAANGPVAVAVVHGLGGVGKSTLAARYAVAQADTFNPIWWITADSAVGVQAGLAGLATALQPELAQALPLEALAERAYAWLATHTGWLLVLDNVNEPTDAAPLLDRTLAGRVLVTSRLREGWHRLGAARVLRLDVLSESEAVQLISEIISHDRPRGSYALDTPSAKVNLGGAAALAEELGYLPLAIEQAAAYLHQSQLTPAAYLELLAEYPAVVYDQHARSADANRSIARIWRLTFDRLADTPLAGQILRILAWYGAEPVPRMLLKGLDIPPPLVHQALGGLAAYNMITLSPDDITVHRLVQAVARTPDSDDPHRQAADIASARDTATALLAHIMPSTTEDPVDWPLWRTLMPHITALAGHSSADDDTLTTIYLLNSTGVFLKDQGVVAQAISYLQRALTTSEKVLDAENPNMMAPRNNLASAYEAAGDLGRAIPLYERTLADCERVLGANHPLTLSARNNLASAFGKAGDLGRAIPLLKRTVVDRERILGPDHHQTLTSRNNLASAYQAAGHLGKAIPLYERTLADYERLLGTDHPGSLLLRHNLAGAYNAAGDLSKTIPIYERALADRERVLGAHHPNTLTTRSSLALAYQRAGKLDEALRLLERTLADRERMLGSDHHQTLSSRNNLAGALQAAGDLDQAIPLFERTLADSERAVGPNHPNTLTFRNNLAGALQVAGDLDRAIPLYERTLADCERVLGPDHPDTHSSRNNLASIYEEMGELDKAIPLYERTLADRERVLGPDHHYTRFSRNNLASTYEMAGFLHKAIPLYEQMLADWERVLGPNHPDTLFLRHNLAGTYEAAGDLGKAIPIYRRTLDDYERTLGADHYATKAAREALLSLVRSKDEL